MATATIRPNGTIYGGGALTGGAGSTHATLADDSDGTYASKASGSPPDHVRMGTTTKPAGAILSTVRPWMKLQSSSGTTKADFWAGNSFGIYGPVYGLTVTSTPTIYYGPTVAVGDQVQSWIDALEMAYRTPSGSNTRFIEAGIDLVFPEPPTVSITAPTGTVSSSDFTIEWTHTPGTDGAGQSAYQLKVYTLSQARSTTRARSSRRRARRPASSAPARTASTSAPPNRSAARCSGRRGITRRSRSASPRPRCSR
jgi:hypothetical protein